MDFDIDIDGWPAGVEWDALTVRAHAARTDRPFEEGPVRREKRSAGASERVRCGERGRAHHHRTEHRRIELGRPLLLASCARR